MKIIVHLVTFILFVVVMFDMAKATEQLTPSADLVQRLVQIAVAKDEVGEAVSKGKDNIELSDICRGLEEEGYAEVEKVIEREGDVRTLYVAIVSLYEEFNLMENVHDRILFEARELLEIQLAKQGTEEAYRYFMRLKPHYGHDGAGSTHYGLMELRYLKKYSQIPKVLLELSDEKASIGELEALLALARMYADGQTPNARYKHLYTAVVVAALKRGNACAKRIVAKWHTKAAEQNDVETMMLLADMYMNDEFRLQDLEKGVYWLKKAAAAGDQEAKEKLKFFEK